MKEVSTYMPGHGVSMITRGIVNGVDIYTFKEHDLVISGEEHHLREFAEIARAAEGTIGDLRYQIEYYFDIDGIRSDYGNC